MEVTRKDYFIQAAARNWEEACRLAAQPLLEEGRMEADYVQTLLQDNGRIGLSSGSTIRQMLGQLRPGTHRGLEIIQLKGMANQEAALPDDCLVSAVTWRGSILNLNLSYSIRHSMWAILRSAPVWKRSL